MSRVLTAKEICEQALGAIGYFPVTESAADGEQLRRAMTWFDLICAEIGGTGRLFSIITATITLEIENGTGTYNLSQTLGAELPPDGLQFPVEAWLEDAQGNRTPLTIVPLDVFEAVPKGTEPGPPTMIHIDRLPNPTLRTYPTPASTDTTEYFVKLIVQTYHPNVAPAGVTGTQPLSSVTHAFRQAWQRLLIFRLAHDLGSGPITKLAEASLNRFDKIITAAKEALEAFENREHETQDPICEAWGM